MSVFIGIDLGTQSSKVVAYDAQARRVIEIATAPLDLISRNDGTREQLAHWWIEALQQCMWRLTPAVRARCVALGVSGQQHGFVALDAMGQVLIPVKLWCDTSTVAECDEISEAMGGAERCIELAGNPILTGYTASKVRWMKKNHSSAYRDLATILLPHDYLNFYLTGERFCECGDASGTAWFDVRRRTWSPQVLAAIDAERDLRECLPSLLSPDAMVPLCGRAAVELGLPRDVLVSVGGGDNMMAAIGTRNVRPGRLTLSLGTSGTLFGSVETPVVDRHGEVAAFCSSAGGWLPLICTMNCTVATEQIRRLFGFELQNTDSVLSGTRPGAGGMVTLPFYNGERTPNLPQAKATLAGLDVQNATGPNLLRSAMEGATFGLRRGLDALSRLGLSPSEICLTGGGASSAVWRQMTADIFNLPVVVLPHEEGASLGAALQAAWAHARRSDPTCSLADLVDDHLAAEKGNWYAPDASAVAAYSDSYALYLRHLSLFMTYYAHRGL